MRDILLIGFIFCTLPFILRRAWVGVLVWAWLGYMNPHRLTWGSAYSYDFIELVATITLISLLFLMLRRFFGRHRLSQEETGFPWRSPTVFWILFVLWTSLTTLFAINHSGAMHEWDRFIKTSLLIAVSLILITNRVRLTALVWVVVGSLAFYGVKGGVFTIMTGGQYHVLGPPSSFIAGNNEIAFALIMILPFMRFLQLHAKNRWVRLGLVPCMLLCVAAIAGSQSRGAFVAGGAILVTLWLRSRRKLLVGVVIVVTVAAVLGFMPASWHERMASISDYREDGSALGRLNAWGFAFNLALDRPILGGGFRTFTQDLFSQYAPDPTRVHDAHSVYFEVLGEHGFVGLLLFLGMGIATLRTGFWIARRTRERPDLLWARDLAAMTQVSLVGFAVGGAFLGLAYFDLPYHIMVIMVATQMSIMRSVESNTEAPSTAMGPVIRSVDNTSAPAAAAGRH